MRTKRATQVLMQAMAIVGLTAVLSAPLGATPAQDEPAIAQPVEDARPLTAGTDNLDAGLVDMVNATGLGNVWLDQSELQRELAFIVVDGAAVATAREKLLADAGALIEVRVLVDLVEVRERAAVNRVTRTEILIDRRTTMLGEVQAELAMVSAGLSQAAVERYVMGRSPAPLSVDLTLVYDIATNRSIVDAAVEDLSAVKSALEQREADLVTRLAELDVELAEATTAAELATGQRVEQATRLAELEELVPDDIIDLERARRLSTVSELGISLVTLDAYVRAANLAAESQPECGVRWQAIAALGRVESNHGRSQSASVDYDGQTTVRILGPLLDGSSEIVALVGDSDGGGYDGNAEFDRAVGPMQFLPSSWQVAGYDGNGDGAADPDNLYDAAYSAAIYLCDRGPSPFTNDSLLRESFLSYNFSGEYADEVYRWVQTYDDFVLPLAPAES